VAYSSQIVNSLPLHWYVTLHAVRRYLERELGVRARKHDTDDDVVRRWERITGHSREDVRDELSAQVVSRLGAPSVNLGEMRINVDTGAVVIREGNVVVTYVGA
jgi:hypothetical protein